MIEASIIIGTQYEVRNNLKSVHLFIFINETVKNFVHILDIFMNGFILYIFT